MTSADPAAAPVEAAEGPLRREVVPKSRDLLAALRDSLAPVGGRAQDEQERRATAWLIRWAARWHNENNTHLADYPVAFLDSLASRIEDGTVDPPAAQRRVTLPADLLALSEAATPGPWEFGTAPHPDSDETAAEYVVNALTHNGPLWTCWAHDGSTDVDYVIPALTGDGPTSAANAAFIAAAVNYVRTLAAADPATEEGP